MLNLDDFPKSFKDTKSREWCLSISALAYIRVLNSTLKIDLKYLVFLPKGKTPDGAATRPLYELIEEKFGLFVSVVYEIIRPDAERLNVSFEEFANALDGEAILNMTNAFTRGLYDFFQDARKLLLLDVATKGKAMMTMMEKKAATEIPRTTELMLTMAEKEVSKALKKFAADMQPLPE